MSVIILYVLCEIMKLTWSPATTVARFRISYFNGKEYLEHEIMYIFYQLVQAITVSACNEPDLLIMRLTDALHNIHSIYIGEE